MRIQVFVPKAESREEYLSIRGELYQVAQEWFNKDEFSASLPEEDFTEWSIRITSPLVYNEFSVFASHSGRQDMSMTWDELHSELPLLYLNDTIKYLLESGILIEKQIDIDVFAHFDLNLLNFDARIRRRQAVIKHASLHWR